MLQGDIAQAHTKDEWIDLDQLAIAPHARALLIKLRLALGRIPSRLHRLDRRQRKALFKLQYIRQILVVEAWSIRCCLNIQPVIDHADQIIRDCRDNRRPARRPHGYVVDPLDGTLHEEPRLDAGAMAFAGPWISPNPFGTPIFDAKSSISSFNRNPSPATVTPDPNPKFSV